MKSFLNRSVAVFFIMLLVIGTLPGAVLAKTTETDYDEYDLVATADGGMVSTSHPLATEVGAHVLKKGGNAVDAAIAIQFALNVTEPMMTGIGGGGFMMVYDEETGETTIVNSRERAPAGAEPDMFLNENGEPIPFAERIQQGTAVGVPGTLKGLEEAHERWGTKPMQKLISPAIRLAKKGFTVDRVLAESIAENQEKLMQSTAADVFLPGGEPLQEGDHIVQEDLADTLKLIRAHGADVFYEGEIAEALAATVQEYGGSMTEEDLENYNVTVDEPVWGEYDGHSIASMPPPSSGGVFLLQMLGILEGFDLSQYERRSTEVYHLLAETMHLAYADRGVYAGDPEFVDIPVDGLLDPDYIAERRELIDLEDVNENPTAGDPWAYEETDAESAAITQPDDRKNGQTTHFSVADKWGNVVSYTTTIEQVFGSGIMVPGYGFMLNNELTDFDAVPGGANEVQPNKRPMSSMSPTMVFENGEPMLALGSPGGPTIITTVLQTILNVLEFDMELEEAIEEPRIYSSNLTTYLHEEGIPADVLQELNDLGHSFGEETTMLGNVQAVQINQEGERFKGVADYRRDGAAIGVELKGNGKDGHHHGKGNEKDEGRGHGHHGDGNGKWKEKANEKEHDHGEWKEKDHWHEHTHGNGKHDHAEEKAHH